MDESLFLQDSQMIRGNAVLKTDGIPNFCERGSGTLMDGLKDQEADLPLKDLLPGEARMLEHRESCCSRGDDGSADLNRGHPEKWRRSPSFSVQANGEGGAPPGPHGDRACEGGCIAYSNPHLIHVRR